MVALHHPNGFSALAVPHRLRIMIVALAQIGCVGALVAPSASAAVSVAVPPVARVVEAPVLYLAQAPSDYSKLPGKRPSGIDNSPPPPPPTGRSGNTGSGGSINGGSATKPPSGSEAGIQKR